MSVCPGCGRCRECGQPAPVSPGPWPNVPYPPNIPWHPPSIPWGQPFPYTPGTALVPIFGAADV